MLEIVSIKTRNYVAGAMPTLDAEPLDGVSYANGVFGYITLVRLLNHATCKGFLTQSRASKLNISGMDLMSMPVSTISILNLFSSPETAENFIAPGFP